MFRLRTLFGTFIGCVALWVVSVPCEARPHAKETSAHSAHKHSRGQRHGAKRVNETNQPETTKPDTSDDTIESSPHGPDTASSEPAPPRGAEAGELEGATRAAEALEVSGGPDTAVGSDAVTDPEEGLVSRAGAALSVAGGATFRSVELTGIDGLRRLNTGWVPAIALEVRVAVGAERAWLGFAARYDTSLHTFGSERSPDPTGQGTSAPIRSHRFEGGVRPSLRFGSTEASFAGGVFLGYGLRAFSSVVELHMPRFTEHGPLARLELDIPLAGSRLRLRIAPEFQALFSISRAVRRIGATDTSGMAIGGEAGLRLQLLDGLALAIDYRESHAIVSSGFAEPFRDIERFVLLRLGLRL